MKRELFGEEVLQKSKSEFFSATALVRAGNKWRASEGMQLFNLAQWLNSKPTKEFIVELEREFGKVISTKRGRGAHTWVHPLLFIDLALAISPKLKVETYKWLFDNLIKFRNNSGDSYKCMCGALYERHGNKRTFPDYIKKVALQIQAHCGVRDWQEATEEQLSRRDELHKNIALLCSVLKNNNDAVRIAIEQARSKDLMQEQEKPKLPKKKKAKKTKTGQPSLF